MKATTKKRTDIHSLEEGDWLIELLSDVQREVASQPSPSAVNRIRDRLFASIETPAKVAA
jgi:hypothetical protein